MNNPVQPINAIASVGNPLTHSAARRGFLCLALGLSLSLLPTARAVSPPPDGGYPNGNTAEGEDALFFLTTGGYNTAIGGGALWGLTTGNYNTAVGNSALPENSDGSSNTAIGFLSMYYNGHGSNNTAVGIYALAGVDGIVTASDNTAIGADALANMSLGNQNTATGVDALLGNYDGSNNTATGFEALSSFLGVKPSNNTANGAFALHNTSGSSNTAVGFNAMLNNTTGNSNIALGESAGSALTTGKNNIDIGNAGTAGESAKIRIGNKAHKNTYIAGISGVTVAGGVGVIIDTTGHLGTVTSSRRYKEAIQPMKASSEAILSLQPVKFRYKKKLDAQGIPQFGLVAEDVAKVNPDLVARDEEGKPYTVRYEAVNAMLLNEFLKEHRKVEEQAATIEQQERRLTELERAVAELR